MSKGLKRTKVRRLLALEPRVLFDGALVDSLAAVPKPVAPTDVTAPEHPMADASSRAAAVAPAPEAEKVATQTAAEAAASAPSPVDNLHVGDAGALTEAESATLGAALAQAQSILDAFVKGDGYDALMHEVFGRAGTDAALFDARLAQLREGLKA